MQQDQDRQDGRTEVIVEPTTASPPEPLQMKTTFIRIGCTSCLPLNFAVVGPIPAFIWEEDQGHYKYDLATTMEGDRVGSNPFSPNHFTSPVELKSTISPEASSTTVLVHPQPFEAIH